MDLVFFSGQIKKKKYVGQYKEDKKHGYGVFIWPDSRKYEGFWSNGKQHGYGIMVISGVKKFGEWKNGQKLMWIEENEENSNLLEKIKARINESSLYLNSMVI